MSEPIDGLYFVWLCQQVGFDEQQVKNPSRTYWRMLRKLFTKEFVWFVPNDNNRIEDGKDLRYEFVEQSGLEDVDRAWTQLGCSILELMVGLSRRLAFEADGQPREWFWQLVINAGLSKFSDAAMVYEFSEEMVDEILDRIIFRNYQPSGHGGFFPLQRPVHDQRKIELWYQLNAYLLEL